ncbi:MAG: hypothetical protein KJ558_03495 [Gammaproteobacteria bacterium]|nr:hypothetical protein [Gammaproteobacteria bacterium]MBU1653889.1 hypothetical protein [Gammaproteobacteria bacterium]MBU1962601.1 hypothetical protein [Gammaproteobacteria bacterium]
MFSRIRQTLLKPDAEALKPHLYPPAVFEPLSFSRLPKGIDNIHYDVAISPDLRRVVVRLVRIWLQNALYPESGKTQRKLEVDQLETLHKTYLHLSENAVHLARRQRGIQVLQLFQIGITKFLLQTTREEAQSFRQELQDQASKARGDNVERHEKLVVLAKEEPLYLYGIRRKLFGHLHKLEQTKLRRIRHSLLGAYWPVPQRLIINPMLTLPSLHLDEAVMNDYHLLLTDREGLNGFNELNRIVTHLFNEYLPGEVLSPVGDEKRPGQDNAIEVRNRLDQGTLAGFLEAELFLRNILQDEEYRDGIESWLDVPDNMSILFPPDESYECPVARTRQTSVKWRSYLVWLAEAIRLRLKRADLLERVSAHPEAVRLYRVFNGRLPVRIIYHYLAGLRDKKQLQRYLSSQNLGSISSDEVARQLHLARRKVQRRSKVELQRDISDCLLSFARFRCDLKNVYRAYVVMDQIRILRDKSDIELSRANNSLHLFYRDTEGSSEQQNTDIINHVILKADLRGSTHITEQLVKQGLNPATHFSLNFFDPINKLLDAFGAEKVFVEGDAVILSIFEYGDKNTEWVCVSRACCLARRMIEVMDNQNSKNRSNGLPTLEMGIGIAFSNGPPAFLYDGNHRIMISPAINRASQLSNCSAVLRNSPMGEISGDRGLRVVTASEDLMDKIADDRLLRYNVNGIELDLPAFLKLQHELSLYKGNDKEDKETRYFMGQVTDKLGALHTLVIRDCPVREWRDNRIGAEDRRGRRYFEVVSEAEKVHEAKRLLDAATSRSNNPPPEG